MNGRNRAENCSSLTDLRTCNMTVLMEGGRGVCLCVCVCVGLCMCMRVCV